MEVFDILKELVKFNTVEDKENKEIIDFIEKYLKKYNFKLIKKDKYLIMESDGKKDEVGLGFLGHTDTVAPNENWKYDPYSLTMEGNKLFGLGVCDMKGGISAFLSAINKVDLNMLNKKIRVYFTYDEEIGFSGIKELINIEKEFPKVTIIGEPTDNEILVGSKGIIELKVSFKGKKVHSGISFKGKSAIFECVSFINELKNFYDKEIKDTINNSYDVPFTTFNIGIINGGSEINSVAEDAYIMFDFRTINDNEKEILKYVDMLAKKYNAKLEKLNVIPAFLNKSKFTDEMKTCSFITEASFINGERLILGPGPVNPHEVDEYIEIESLNLTVENYIKIIKEVCM